VPTSSDDVVIDTASAETITIQSGDSIQVQSITTSSTDTLSITGGSLTVTAGTSTLSGPLSMTGGSLTASGSGVNLTAGAATTVSSASLYAKSGATLSLRQMTSYASDNNIFQADGAKSVLDVSGLTDLTQQGPWDIDATNGGTLNLSGLTGLTCTDIISVTDTGGSTLNLGNLTSLTSTISFGYGISITDTGGSTLQDGKLTTLTADQLAGIVVSLDGTDAHIADSWTSFTDSNLNVTGGTYTLPGLSDVDGASLYVAGGVTLALPGLRNLDANFTTFQADGAGSVLDLSALSNVTQEGPLWLNALSGGTLKLGSLTSLTSTQEINITDTGGSALQDGDLTDLGGVDVTLDGTDAQVASAWTTFAGSISVTGGTQTLPKVATASFSALEVDAGSTLDLPVSTADVTGTGDMTIGGTLDIAGDLTLTSAATLDEQIGGAPGSGQVGQTEVVGSVALDGTFNLDLVGGFTPSTGQDFSVLKYGSASGTFAAINDLPNGMIADQSATEFDLNVPATPTISWTNPGSGFWDVAANWNTGVVPNASDVVTIDTAGNATITIQPGDDIQVQSLTTGVTDTLSITGGSLTVTGGVSTLGGPLSMTGGSLTASGSGVNLTAGAAATVSSASLLAEQGATLSLPQMTSYTSNSDTFFQADGANSVLDVSALTNETEQPGSYFQNEATDGGKLNLDALTSLTANGRISITDTGGSALLDAKLTGLNAAGIGSIAVSVDGTDTQFDASWTSFTNSYLFVVGGKNALPKVTNIDGSELLLSNSATLALPDLTTLDSAYSDFQVDGSGGELDLSALTSVTTTGPLYISVTGGATLNLSGLASLSSTQALRITDIGGSIVEDGDLTSLSGANVSLDGTDAQVASAWRSFSGNLTLTGGSLTLPNVATARFSGLEVDAGATLDLPVPTGSVTDTGDMTIGGTLDIAGNLTLTSAATLDEQIAGAPGSGQVGQIDVGGSAALNGTFNLDLFGFTPSVGQDFPVLTYANASGTFAAVNGLPQGMVADQGATSFDLDVPATATIRWTNPNGGKWDVAANWSTGVVPSGSDVVTIDTAGAATITIQSGDNIQVQSLTTASDDTLSITGGSLTVTAGQSILDGPLSMAGGSLTASGSGVNLTASGATTISTASLSAEGGAALSLSQMTSYVSNGSTFQADGANSELNVSALASVTQQGPWDIDATNGGTLNLGSLTSLTSTQGIAITDTGGSTLLDGKLTGLSGVGVTLDGTDTQVASEWKSFAGIITLTGGSDTLTNVSSASFSGIQLAAGSTLSLPAGTASVTGTGTMTIGAGSELSIAGNLTLTSTSTLNEQIGGTPSSGQFGRIVVGGTVTLAGTFDLQLLGGFTSSIGQDFAVITYANATATFSTVTGLTEPGSSFMEEVNASSVDLIGVPPPPAFTADTPPTGVANSSYSYQFQATAAGAPAITFSATGLPA